MANPNGSDSNDHFSEEGTELALTPLPNPFSDRITIKGSAGTSEEPVQIALFNSEGVLVKQEEAVIEGDHTLATDDLPPGLYFLQLVANLGWSYLFFRYHLATAALIDIAALWVLAFMMTREFHRHSRIAAMMQYPYLAWLTFAAYLNTWIVVAN